MSDLPAGITVSYEWDGAHLLCVHKKPNTDSSWSRLQMRMLHKHMVPGFLRLHHMPEDEGAITYALDGRKKLQTIIRVRGLSFQQFLRLLRQVVHVLDESSAWMLPPSNILLDPEYMYATDEMNELQLLYLPLAEPSEREAGQALRNVAAEWLGYVDAVKGRIVPDLMKRLSEPECSMSKLRDQLSAWIEEAEQAEEEMTTVGGSRPRTDQLQPQKRTVQPASRTQADEASAVNTGPLHDAPALAVPDSTKQALKSKKEPAKSSVSFSRKLAYILAAVIIAAAGVSMLPVDLDTGQALNFLGMILLAGAVAAFIFLRRSNARKRQEQQPEIGIQDEEWDALDVSWNLDEHYANLPLQTECLKAADAPQETVLLSSCAAEAAAAVEERKVAWQLQQLKDTDVTIPICADPVVIGRDEAAAGRVFEGSDWSRLHAELFEREGLPCVRDLGSRNGTFVNGRRITPYQPYVLEEGDEVHFAEYAFVCRAGASSPVL